MFLMLVIILWQPKPSQNLLHCFIFDWTALVTTFNLEIGITGAILTKLDGDSRGGAALSVKEVCLFYLSFHEMFLFCILLSNNATLLVLVLTNSYPLYQNFQHYELLKVSPVNLQNVISSCMRTKKNYHPSCSCICLILCVNYSLCPKL